MGSSKVPSDGCAVVLPTGASVQRNSHEHHSAWADTLGRHGLLCPSDKENGFDDEQWDRANPSAETGLSAGGEAPGTAATVIDEAAPADGQAACARTDGFKHDPKTGQDTLEVGLEPGDPELPAHDGSG